MKRLSYIFQESMGIYYYFRSPKMDVAIADCPIKDSTLTVYIVTMHGFKGLLNNGGWKAILLYTLINQVPNEQGTYSLRNVCNAHTPPCLSTLTANYRGFKPKETRTRETSRPFLMNPKYTCIMTQGADAAINILWCLPKDSFLSLKYKGEDCHM
jgi:hypothetical protein